jgi:1-acyl-sn-glycerol-3-phosphate acyltransferase
MKPEAATTPESPRISPWLLYLFARYNRHYLGRHFHSLRILKSGLPKSDRPAVIYLNHASWWDPLVCLFLAGIFFSDRASFAPINEQMLQRYRFFKRLGFFGIEPDSARGALSFIRTVDGILKSPQNLLWLTPQGRFADARERPARLKSGLGAIANRMPEGVFLPLAIEYPFWTEPQPEVLISFGEPIVTQPSLGLVPNEWTAICAQALEHTQDQLASRSERRDERDWIILRRGSRTYKHGSARSSARHNTEMLALTPTPSLKS